ncbi:MAG: DNA phosphorothioation-dependent restriction protein DptH [Sulfuricurvum sp.]|nr:DNA phosphorothioation-dependent restriction protein DptH [Sulfuricurvum sp.]
MSNQQFNIFLVERLEAWLGDRIKSGYRYRFHSDDSTNITSLIEALNVSQSGTIIYEKTLLPYIEINSIKLVYVNDVENTMNENFISGLRDAVSRPEEVFHGCALLVLHKSRLDTVLNSATDLASSGGPFHASSVEKYLNDLITSKTSNRTLFKELMKIQTNIIKEEQQSAFGYYSIYNSIINDRIVFKELGLFDDIDLLKEDKSEVIKKRLENNQKLHDEIETNVINFSSELEDKLKQYSPEFIDKHFIMNDWEDVTYNKLTKELDKNRGETISFEYLNVNYSEKEIRSESDTASGKRIKNIIIFTDENNLSLFFKFKGDRIQQEQFKILDNKELEKATPFKYMGISRTLEVNIPFDYKPLYFKLKLNGAKSADTHTFKILILKKDSFNLDTIKNHFIVNTNKQEILLQLNHFDLNFSNSDQEKYELTNDDDVIDIIKHPRIDIENFYNANDEVAFSITNGTDALKLKVEGEKEKEGFSIPLIFNQDRLDQLFTQGINAEFKQNSNKAILDNRESPLIAERLTFVELEQSFINETIFYKKQNPLEVSLLVDIDKDIHVNFLSLLEYFKVNKTTPSLCAWDDGLCEIASKFVDSFHHYMQKVQNHKAFTDQQKHMFNIGKVDIEGKEYLSPFSPLILAYVLHLRNTVVSDTSNSYKDLADVTLERLNPKGLFPYLYKGNDQYAYTKVVTHDQLWLEFIPNEENEFGYVAKLTTEKILEFIKAFEQLFEFRHDAPLIINSINNSSNSEVFKGLLDYYKNTFETNPKKIIINLYDKKYQETAFDIFADTNSYEELKNKYKLNQNAETIIDVMRTHITYSKHLLNEKQSYCHLSLFKNNEKVQVKTPKVNDRKSGLVCNGLISGESSEKEDSYYYSGFGLKHIDISEEKHLKVAKIYNALQRAAFESGTPCDEDEVISLMISDRFKELLKQSYENALWTVIIDPKVTLDFFSNEKDLILIHYSDQYSSSANYDAITVTAQKELYANVVRNSNSKNSSSSSIDGANIIREFNAFNGEWLIKMISEKDERNKREKRGIIAAYKYMTALVDAPNITWVPLSVAEMIRVAGNVGLSMSKGDFSRYNANQTNDEKHIGYISDDILLVGFTKDGVVLYPVEVKSGSASLSKAIQQAKSLKSFFYDFLFYGDSFKSNLLKGLFIRQVFMQVEKYELYDVFDSDYFKPLHANREELLKGTYPLVELNDYSEGAVIAYLDAQTWSSFSKKENILECILPSSYQELMLEETYESLKIKMRNGEYGTNEDYILKDASFVAFNSAEDLQNEKPQFVDNIPTMQEIEQNQLPVQTAITISQPITPMQIRFGTNVENKKEILWYPTDSSKTLNTNTAIIGTMGTGKTQFTKSVITQIIQNSSNNIDSLPIDILIFNYKAKDYLDDQFVTTTNAKVHEPYHLPFNPLSLFGSRPLLPVHTANLFKTTLSKAFGLGPVQQSNLNRIIMEAYEQKGISKSDPSTWTKPAPTIHDIWEIYSNEDKVAYDSLYAALEKLNSFEIFEPDSRNTTSLFDMLDGMTVINIAGYDPDIQNLIVAITLDIFYTQMQTKGASAQMNGYRQMTKMLLVDEADNFMSQDFESLRKILKEGREFGVGTILSTQQLSHFKTSDNDYTEYILSWIIHKVDKIKSQDVSSIFNISNKAEAENLMDQIRQLEEHFSIYVDGKKNMNKMRDLAFWELEKDKNA